MTAVPAGGILHIDKPVGITSFGVVSRVRRVMKLRRVGHCGTLDPFACGVLPILLGRATGIARYMEGYDKSYRVTVRFGFFTDTQDRTGIAFGGRIPSDAERDAMVADGFRAIRTAVADLAGDRMQMPPMYSAVKIDGRPLYQYARKGVEVERKARPIHVFRSELLSVGIVDGLPEATVEIDCSKGTYIRTLCQDLGEATGWGAHAAELTRTACGPFTLDGSLPLHKLEEWAEENPETLWDTLRIRGILLPMETAISTFPIVRCGADAALRFAQGRPLGLDEAEMPVGLRPELRMAVHGPDGFVGVGLCRQDDKGSLWIHAERVFALT